MRLDPNVETGVEYTLAHLIERPADMARIATRGRGTARDRSFAAGALGSPDVARKALRELDPEQLPRGFRVSLEALAASVSLPPGDAIPIIERAIGDLADPEALFMFGVMLIRLGATTRGLDVIGGAVRSGYTPASTLAHNDVFDAVRRDASFIAIEAEARRRVLAASAVFDREGGPTLLGMPPPTRLGPA